MRLSLLILLVALCLCWGCSTPLAPEYLGFDNLQIVKADAEESVVKANIRFYNPNHFNLQLKRAEMDIFLNDKKADHYLLDSTINIPKLDSFFVPVMVKVNLNSILQNALQAFLSNQVKISIDGKVRLKRGGITVNRPFHYEGMQKLDALYNSIR